MIFRSLFRRKAAPPPTKPNYDVDLDRKMDEAKEQNQRAHRIAEEMTETTSEFSRIVSRVKRDDPIFTPGTRKKAGGI